MSESARDQARALPENPGCYLMKDASDVVIYVGKAKNLKRRVNSYFLPIIFPLLLRASTEYQQAHHQDCANRYVLFHTQSPLVRLSVILNHIAGFLLLPDRCKRGLISYINLELSSISSFQTS